MLERRADGFHEIESVLVPIQYCDCLEIIMYQGIDAENCDMEVLGNTIDEVVSDNLCVKAYELVASNSKLPAVKIRLLKNIPTGAGLGGGSSDAAFTIKMLNKLFDLELSNDLMKSMCAELGSDCSFFIENKISMSTGRGEVLEPFELDLEGKQLVMVQPDLQVSTRKAYERIVPNSIRRGHLQEFLSQPIETWQENVENDFESSVFDKNPELKSIKQELYNQGALYASMTGSGSALFGIFDNEVEVSVELSGHRVEKCPFLS